MEKDMTLRYARFNTWPVAATDYYKRRPSPFISTRTGKPMPLSATIVLLEKELRQLGAQNIVIQTDHEQGDRNFRRDGGLRADARRPSSPGVIVSFDCKHGALSYPCDRFHDWEANLRAIAYHLEHVRMATIYGVGECGEPYKGFAALPAAPQEDERWQAARVILSQVGAADATLAAIQRFLEELPSDVIAQAVRHAHPDYGGTRERLESVLEARKVLSKTYG